MRLTLVTETFFPQVNGVSRTLGKLVDVLRQAGDQVQIVRPDYGKRDSESHRKEALTVRAIPLPFYPEVIIPLPPFRRVLQAIGDFQPDLIHVATEATLGWAALQFARREGIPVVSSFHTNFDQYGAHYGFGWANALIWNYLRRFHNETLQVYVPSPGTIESLEARGFERLILWPRGVESDRFRPDRPGRRTVRAQSGWGDDVTVIGHVGRLAVEKNIDYLGDALEIAAERRPNLRFLIVGDGPARSSLESKLGDSATFAGFRDGDDLADHYAALDLFAFSSLTETFGNVVLEAMASGLPVLALREGGVADLIRDEETGRLLEPDATPERFADALLDLADDHEIRGRLGQAAREHALGQSWESIMLGLRSRYEEALSQFRQESEKIRKN